MINQLVAGENGGFSGGKEPSCPLNLSRTAARALVGTQPSHPRPTPCPFSGNVSPKEILCLLKNIFIYLFGCTGF